MASITIWALESDYDAKAVKCLAGKLADHLGLDDISIRAVGSSAKPRKPKGNKDPADALKRMVELYLKEDKCVIFVIDEDGPMASHQRRQEQNSLVNQVGRVMADNRFSGSVHLAWAVREMEAWLLIDCTGIICYFASKRKPYRDNCREKIRGKADFSRLANKFQSGNTEFIVEAEAGGKGVKEYLTNFSREIFRMINPKVKHPPKDKLYKEKFSPEIAKFIQINSETLKRNNSLRRLRRLIAQCES